MCTVRLARMNKLQSIIVFVGLLLFGYQNCSVSTESKWAQNGNTVSGTTTTFGSSGSSSTMQTVFGQQSNVQKVSFYDREPVSATNSKIVSAENRYVIDFNSGQVQLLDADEKFVRNYCLSEKLKTELTNILYSSKVCKNNPQLPEGTVCAEIFKMPYAEVETSNDVVPLGSASNSCGSNSIDLCDDQANVLKNWFKDFKSKLEQLNCN